MGLTGDPQKWSRTARQWPRTWRHLPFIWLGAGPKGTEPIIIGAKDYGGAQIQGVHSEIEYTQESITFTMGPNNTTATIFAYKHEKTAPAYADALSLTLEADAPQPEPQPNLQLVWSDEFDGSGPLDPTKWTFEELPTQRGTAVVPSRECLSRRWFSGDRGAP